jgi:hypothetical protein
MSADYAAILRRDAAVTAEVPQPYLNALSVIRELMRTDTLTDAAKVAKTRLVLDALVTVQEELDAEDHR